MLWGADSQLFEGNNLLADIELRMNYRALMQQDEPAWLPWARELQAMAQCGLTFTKDPYDRERYERLRELSAEIFEAHTEVLRDTITGMFTEQTGYATPKVDVRVAVFDNEDRLLMVRETADDGRWTLPGGWADVNLSAADNAIKEVKEETGYEVRVTKLAAVWDRTRQKHPVGVFSCCKMFFLGEVEGGEPTTGLETSEIKWFSESDLPADLSLGRVLPHQLLRMFEHRRNAELATDYD
jgi:ADP-ribose pyrophosphatase YjhB (NUDIX family)